VIAIDVTPRLRKGGGKWVPWRFWITPAPFHHFGTFIKNHHNHLFPPWNTFYICKKNFSSMAHAPLREHRLLVNSGQMWGDMRSRDAVGFSESLRMWGCGCLQLETQRAGTPECSCFTWTVFPLFFSFFSPAGICLIAGVVTGTVFIQWMMSLASLSTVNMTDS